MKKIIILILCLMTAGLAQAQSFHLVWADSIPAPATELLMQRFAQMLEAGGFSLAEDGAPLEVQPAVSSRMETPGSMSQVALAVELTLVAGEVSEVFTLKGVGSDDNDAWLRAVKQFLPRSKNAQNFVQRLKRSE